MENRRGRIGVEDGKMTSYVPQLTASHSLNSESNRVDSSRATNLRALDHAVGFQLDDSVIFRSNPILNPTSSSQALTSHSHQDINFIKPVISSDIAQTNIIGSQKSASQKGKLSNPFSLENWGESPMADASSKTDTSTDVDTDEKNQRSLIVTPSDSSERSKEKTGDQKTLRRLAQNREAARKSRLRKKAYVQQLENSRLKLTQLEQELQRARQQGIFISSGDQPHSMNGNGALAFDVEYARWLEEHTRHIDELRTAMNSHASDNDLCTIVDNVTTHYEDIFRLKSIAAKADVFHMLSGMWKTPAERCFLWLGGFRPSELLKLLCTHLEPLTEQQMLSIQNLQQSSQQAEDALSQGMEALQQSLAETLAETLGPSGSSDNVAKYMGQMAMAMGKLGTLEGFLRQADNLRQQTLQQMHRNLTTRQSARALLAINDYFSRLRALSSLWLARPRE